MILHPDSNRKDILNAEVVLAGVALHKKEVEQELEMKVRLAESMLLKRQREMNKEYLVRKLSHEEELQKETENVRLRSKEIINKAQKEAEETVLKSQIYFFVKATFFLMGTIALSLYVYDFLSRTIPSTQDIIGLNVDGKEVFFVVKSDDASANEITLNSMDQYKEEIKFPRRMALQKIEKIDRERLLKDGWNGKSAVYRYKTRNKDDYGKPDLGSTVIHINSEQREDILKKLPGIGAVRVEALKSKRPFKNLNEVMNARIGIGQVNASLWQQGINNGMILFD